MLTASKFYVKSASDLKLVRIGAPGDSGGFWCEADRSFDVLQNMGLSP